MRRFWLATASVLALSSASDAMAQSEADGPATRADQSLPAGPVGDSNTNADRTTVYLAPVEVTATKRAVTSFDVIGNISVQTSDQLEAAAATKTEDLSHVFPELSNMNRGTRLYNNMTIRGQSGADYFSPSVGLYVDGVPQLSQSYAQSLLGIDQVELLKGPQGVIHGRGTLGGVLSLVTRTPTDEPEVWGGFEYYGRGVRSDLGASTGFLESGWAIQAMITDERHFGTLDNPDRGEENVDTSETTGGWMSVHFRSRTQPFETRVRAGAETYSSREELFVPFSPLSRDVVWNDLGATDRPDLERVLKHITWDATYDVSDTWSVKAVAAYQSMKLNRMFLEGTDIEDAQNSYFTELRANYDTDELNTVMGLSFQKLRYEHENVAVGLWGMGGKISNNDIYNYAAFADGAWRFHPQWEVSAGARVSLENAETEMVLEEDGVDVHYSNDDRFFSVTPRVALAWLPNDQNRLWIGFGQGFKPGGFNKEGVSAQDATSYDSETATNIEAGWKWNSRDYRHSAELTGYGIFSQDVQGYAGPPGGMYLTNMGDARSLGVEATWKSEVIDDHVISVGGMYNDSRFTNGQYDGNKVAYAPQYSALVAWDGRYGSDKQFQSRVALRQNGPFYFNESNSMRQDSYTILDASLMWDTGYGVETGLYAKNLLDTEYRTTAFEGVGAQLGAPREVGFRIRFRL